jgi:hypothetical protein
VSELLYWCSYGKCYIREQKDARPRVDAVTATTSNTPPLRVNTIYT